MLHILLMLGSSLLPRIMPISISDSHSVITEWIKQSKSRETRHRLRHSLKYYTENGPNLGSIAIHTNRQINGIALLEKFEYDDKCEVHVWNIDCNDTYSGTLLVKCLYDLSNSDESMNITYAPGIEDRYKVALSYFMSK